MSGPIIRKYGFPNFDQIFGKKELEHGVDEPEGATPESPKTDPRTGTGEEKPVRKEEAKEGR